MSTTDTAHAREQALDAAAELVAVRGEHTGKPLLQLAHELITNAAADGIDLAGLDLSDAVEVCTRAAVRITGIPDRHEAAQAWADRWYAAHPSTAAEAIAAQAFNAVTNQLGDGSFVPLSERQRIADAVLAAVEPLIRADERNARAIPAGTPRVRVEIQDPHGAWWMPEPGPALTAALTAAADEATLRTIGADFRPRLRAAAAGLIKALDRYGRAGG